MAWSLFGNQTPQGPKPSMGDFIGLTPADQGGDPTQLDANEYAALQAALSDWEYIKGQRKTRQDIYQKMAQKEGALLPGGKYGQDLPAVPPLSMVSRMPPVHEGALYGQTQPFPGVSSIVNPRRKREAV
jgi:hypothetical protein